MRSALVAHLPTASRHLCSAAFACGLLMLPAVARAATTYHLHRETATSGNLLLKEGGPDAAVLTVQSVDLKGQGSGQRVLIRQFDTDPFGSTGQLAGGTLTFRIWMRKTASVGTLYATATGGVAESFFRCVASSSTALTLTLTQYTFSCGVPGDSFTASSRYRVEVHVTTGSNINKTVMAELAIEGVPGGQYDSNADLPPVPPALSSALPTTGPVGAQVNVTGTRFGASQGTSTITFGGVPASVSQWSATTIRAAVPTTAVGGPIVVTVDGVASNAITFTVPPPLISGISPTSGAVGTVLTIFGSGFGPTATGNSVTINGTPVTPSAWTASSIKVSVSALVSSGSVVVSVNGRGTNPASFTVLGTGGLTGTITRTLNGAAIVGASVQAYKAGALAYSTSSNAAGSYSLSGVVEGSYDVLVSAAGYASDLRTGITVAVGSPGTLNIALAVPGSIGGTVTAAAGGAPLAGAAVGIFRGPTEVGRTTTNASGGYAVGNLAPGTYAVQASLTGYRTREEGGVVVPEAGTAARDLALEASAAGAITYVYDELNRLVSVVDAAGESATYTYDQSGNILSIGRTTSGQVSNSEFSPNAGTVGSTVTIYGTGFSATPEANTVGFNGTMAAVQSSTTTRIVATVPAGATTGAISVTTSGGSASSATAFTVGGAAGPLTITGFTPGAADPGNALTITGTNFDPLVANDSLFVNLSRVFVASASPTSLSATAPGGATTGRVSLRTPSGSATTSDYLWIPPSPHTLANVGSMSIAAFAQNNVSISAAGRVALLAFDGTRDQRISFSGTETLSTYAEVTLHSPFGATLMSDIIVGSGFIEPVVLPSIATYSIVIAGHIDGTGGVTLTLHDVPADFAEPIVAGGSSVLASNSVAGQNIALPFSATAGQRVSLNFTNPTFPSCADASIRRADGFVVTTAVMCSSDVFVDTVSLPTAGNYVVFVDPRSGGLGSVTARLYSVPSDDAGTIPTDGTEVLRSTDTPGQNIELAFTGTQGQRISLVETSGISGFSGTDVLIKQPDGGTLVSNFVLTTGFIDTVPLPASGQYKVVVNPRGTGVGSFRLELHTVPADATGTIAANSTAVPISTDVPGQNARMTFSGTQLQRISLEETSGIPGASGVDIRIKNPDGSLLASSFVITTAFLDTQPLPATGQYTIEIDPRGSGKGTVTLKLHTVPADPALTTTVNATNPVTVTTEVPGQNGSVTFAGTLNQAVTVRFSTNLIGGCTAIRLMDGTTALQSATLCGSGLSLTQTLPGTRNYRVEIDPSGINTGSIDVRITNP